MFEASPQDTFAELDARVVLEMAKSRAMGVIVQNVLEKKQPLGRRVPPARLTLVAELTYYSLN